MNLRMERVNKQLMRQIMDVIHKEVDDPAIDFLSITRVETTSDLQESKVYFSLFDESQREKVEEILHKMIKFIRVSLGKRIRLRILPQLKFIPDDSIKYSVDMYHKIEEVKDKDEQGDVEEDNRENS